MKFTTAKPFPLRRITCTSQPNRQQPGFTMNKLNPSLLIAALLLSATVAPGAPTREAVESGLPTISFETRLAAQRAIEEVYWKHRIWPAENPKPKPPLEAVMPLEVIRARVEDSLRLSNALEAYWGQAIT